MPFTLVFTDCWAFSSSLFFFNFKFELAEAPFPCISDKFIDKLAEHKIIIDTIGWSGGNTSLEALFLNKPIITLKGNTLRSNHTAAFLKEIDLEVLIAKNYNEYLQLANKLMENKEFFNFIVSKIIKNKHLIFNKKISLYEKIKDLL